MSKTINTTRFRGTRPTMAQFEAMLAFMENNLNLVNGRLTFNFTVKDRNRLWEELATVLNSQVNGAVKVPSKWRKTWHDWKSSVKSRAAGFRICEGRRVRGVPGEQPLSQLDIRLLSLIGSASSTTNGNGFFAISNVKSLEDSMIFTIAEEEQTGTEKASSPALSPSLNSAPGTNSNSLVEGKSEQSSQLESASTDENTCNSTPICTATSTQNTEDKFEYFSPIVLTVIGNNDVVGETKDSNASVKCTEVNNPSVEDKIQCFSSLVQASSGENNVAEKTETTPKPDSATTSSVTNEIENIAPVVTVTDVTVTKSISDTISPIPKHAENIKSVVVTNGHVPLIFTTNYLPAKEANTIQESSCKRKRAWENPKEKDNQSSDKDYELPALLKEAVNILRRISRASEDAALAQRRIAVANERKAAAVERIAAAAERRATASERRATAAERTSAVAERTSNTRI